MCQFSYNTLEWAIKEFWGFKATLFVELDLRKCRCMLICLGKIYLLIDLLSCMSSKVINLRSDTFGNPIFQKGLQN